MCCYNGQSIVPNHVLNFGGGACLIIKDKIIWQETADDWVKREIKTRQACQDIATLYPEQE